MSNLVSKGLKLVFNKEFGRYLCSTHFWAPLCNWGIPIAAINDIVKKDASMISGKMTITLCVYSVGGMRFGWMVNPRNMLLVACHVTNEAAQIVQGLRLIHYKYFTKPKDQQMTNANK